MTITAVDLLNEAIKSWETKGWVQHTSRDAAGATCSAGGIEWAAMQHLESSGQPSPDLERAFDRAMIAFRAAIKNRGTHSIVSWNDTPSRTKEDVILTAKRAIERLEAGEQSTL